MIRIFITLIIFLTSINIAVSDERTEKLKLMLEKGLITEDEFKKILNLNEKPKNKIQIRKISGVTGKEKFEKYEFYIDNFRVHTLGPGTIRIDNMLTGETDVTLYGNFKTKFTTNGKRFFKFEFDEENLKSNLLYKGRNLINWTGRYVSRYQATFHQMQVDGVKPFHYFIVIPGKKLIS